MGLGRGQEPGPAIPAWVFPPSPPAPGELEPWLWTPPPPPPHLAIPAPPHPVSPAWEPLIPSSPKPQTLCITSAAPQPLTLPPSITPRPPSPPYYSPWTLHIISAYLEPHRKEADPPPPPTTSGPPFQPCTCSRGGHTSGGGSRLCYGAEPGHQAGVEGSSLKITGGPRCTP